MRIRSRSWSRRRGLLAALAFAVLTPGAAAAQFTEPPPPAAYALRDITLVTPDGRIQPGVTVVVRNGLIEALATNASVPADALVLDGEGLHMYPGLIDAQGKIDFAFPRDSIDRNVVRSWAPTRAAQGFVPHRRVVDHLTATGSGLSALRRQGVIAAAVHPTEGIVPGQSTLVLLRPDADTPTELVLDPSLGPVFALRGNRGFYPSTGMGAISFYRQLFLDAARRARVAQAAETGVRGAGLPGFDPDYAIVQQVQGGNLPVWFLANTTSEIWRALRVAEEQDLDITIVGGAEAGLVANDLAEREVPVLVSMDYDKPEQWDPADTTSTPMPGAIRERRALETHYSTAARLAAAGVPFALTSGGTGEDLIEGARKAIEHGLDEQAALRALTVTPAALLGMPALARLQPGAAANFIVSEGPLFAEDGRVRYTFVAGILERGAEGRSAPTADGGEAAQVAGTWTITVQTPEGPNESTLQLTQQGTALSGTIESPMGSSPVSGSVTGNTMTFTSTLQTGGQSIRLEFSGTVEGDSVSGTITSQFGDFDWSGRRTAPGVQEAR